MNLRKCIFSLLTLCITFQIVFSQEKSNSILIDEINALPYDHLRGRLDKFLFEIINDPNSTGNIIIYGDRKTPFAKYRYEILLKKHITYRQFPNNRIVFLHGKDAEQLKAQFWKVPPSADKPVLESEDWNYRLTEEIKPFIFHKNSWIVEDGFEIFSLELYSNFLIANTDLQGNLVIYGKSAKDFQRTKKQLIKDLVKRNKVSPKQLKFFYVEGRKKDIEFWFVAERIK